MTRKRFEKLCLALKLRIAEKAGITVNGKFLRDHRDKTAKSCLERHGSYRAAWEALKGVRETFGFH